MEDEDQKPLIETKIQQMVLSDSDGTETKELLSYFDEAIRNAQNGAFQADSSEERDAHRRMAEALEAGAEILRELWAQHHGHVL